MRKIYPYLKNSSFLLELAKEKSTELFVKIIVLTFDEKPVKEVQGKVLSGNINVDGNSSVRRTGNLSVYIDESEANYMEIGGLFALNKKIKIEIGLLNTTQNYLEYPILWFPQGIYAIVNLSSSYGTSGTTVNLQIKDKMVFLNGECGGKISASTTFHEYDEINPETGDYIIKKPTLVQIIQEVVNHFGGEQLGKIIISDLDTRVKKVMKWNLPNPLYLYINNNDSTSAIFSLEEINSPDYTRTKIYNKGEDIGYIYSDFYCPKELIGNAGDTVCTILDNIKNLLGNFEYYYDLDGNFIFQEIKNYLNTSLSTDALESLDPSNYLIDRTKGKAAYVFEDSEIITSFSNSPQYANVKNDFIVWGMRKTTNGKSLPIRYHLAIDEKPKVGNTYRCYFYEDPEAIDLEDIERIETAKIAIEYESAKDFPTVGDLTHIYYDKSQNQGYYWDPENSREIELESEKLLPTEEKEIFEIKYQIKEKLEDGETLEEGESLNQTTVDEDKDGQPDEEKIIKQQTHYFPLAELQEITTTDWRSELFLSGVNTTRFGTDSNYYYTELKNEWPKLYDIKEGTWKDETLNNPTDLDYFLDFIDSTAAISEFNISNIGRRTHIVTDDSINCIFEPEIPDFVLIENSASNANELKQECLERGQNYILVNSNIYDNILQGGSHNSAFNMIRDLLYQYTGYNESVAIQTLPLFFLEPNIRITIRNKETGIFGDYMLNSFSIPFDINGTMSLSCTRALERI